MAISGGTNGGWVRADGADFDLPGVLYMRLTDVDGHRRVTELYLDGRGSPIPGQALRLLPLPALEGWLAAWLERVDPAKSTIGPDLSRLATAYASVGGGYAGRHCEHCGGPLKYRQARGGQERAFVDWIGLSFYAQVEDSGIPQAASYRERSEALELEPLTLSAPPDGRLTDAFLSDVTRAYRAAVARGLPPAVTLAELAGVEQRTAQSWFYKARKRGIMPPATSQGRIV